MLTSAKWLSLANFKQTRCLMSGSTAAGRGKAGPTSMHMRSPASEQGSYVSWSGKQRGCNSLVDYKSLPTHHICATGCCN